MRSVRMILLCIYQVSSEDISKAIGVLNELTEKTNDTINHVNSLIKKVEEEQISTSKVVVTLKCKTSFKYHVLL